MRGLVLVLMVVCSTAKAQAKPNENIEPRAGDVGLEDMVSADANGLARMQTEFFPVLGYADKAVDPSERCWSQLKSRMIAGYQVMLPSASAPAQRDAYFIAEGDLPRAEVERCVLRAVKGVDLEARPAEDLVAFRTPVGTVYAAWRGRFNLIGSERQIRATIRTRNRDSAARWRTLIAQTPKGTPAWVLSIDQRPTNFSAAVGAPADFIFSIDQIQRTPHPLVAGRFVAHYLSAAMAAKSAAWIKSWSARGAWPFVNSAPAKAVDLFNRMAKAIAKLTLTQQGNRLEVAWDSDQFGGIDQLNAFIQSTGE